MNNTSSQVEKRILVVDDTADTVEVIKRNLNSYGYEVYTAFKVKEAIKVLEQIPVDLVITDIKMPEVSGFDLIRHVAENYKYTEIMVITGYPSIDDAVLAVKKGAQAYLVKPFTEEELFSAVKDVLEKLYRRMSNCPVSEYTHKQGIIGKSEVMREVFRAMDKASSTSATVLITGKSGTGKELVARGIHYGGKRASAPFVPVNCAGIPDQLLESELFGYKKGAFTGATETRAGFFQTADGGTVFLDEISNTSLFMQAKLLRVIEDREVFMVGSRRPQKVDVRIVAATNKDLMHLIDKGSFREDLYYRLNVIPVDIPTLTERGDDILLLIKHFACTYAQELDRKTPAFSEDVLRIFREYHWPGNVRELENIIQRLVVMTDDDCIDVPDLPSLMRFSAETGARTDRSLKEVETDYIHQVLESVQGNKTRAAEILGINRKTLRRKMSKEREK